MQSMIKHMQSQRKRDRARSRKYVNVKFYLPDMFPRENGELPKSIFMSSEPASLEGLCMSWSWMCLMW